MIHKKENKIILSTQKKNLILKFIKEHPDHVKTFFDAIKHDGCMDCVFGKKTFHCEGCVRNNMTICNDGEGSMPEHHCYCETKKCKSCNEEYCKGCISPCESCNLAICRYGETRDSCTQMCGPCCGYYCKDCTIEGVCKSCYAE